MSCDRRAQQLAQVHEVRIVLISLELESRMTLSECAVMCRSFELAARVPLIIRAPGIPQSVGKVVSGFAELVDLFATVADLAGTPPPTDSLDGISLRPFLEEPSRLHIPTAGQTANKSFAFSQYPHTSQSFARGKGGVQTCVFYRDGQCHNNSNTNQQTDLTEADPVPSNWMGFSVRSRWYRYTVWLPAPGGNDTHVDWSASRNLSAATPLKAARFDELYNHSGDTGVDFDAMDTANLAYDAAHAATVERYFSVARHAFEQPHSPSPPTLPPHPRLRIGTADIYRMRTLVGEGGDPEAGRLLKNITLHAQYVLGQPTPSLGSDLLCDVILDHMYTLGIVYHLSTNATFKSIVARRAVAELLSESP
jgi:hypothetical protein